jgi:hypothetical protein
VTGLAAMLDLMMLRKTEGMKKEGKRRKDLI